MARPARNVLNAVAGTALTIAVSPILVGAAVLGKYHRVDVQINRDARSRIGWIGRVPVGPRYVELSSFRRLALGPDLAVGLVNLGEVRRSVLVKIEPEFQDPAAGRQIHRANGLSPLQVTTPSDGVRTVKASH